MRLKGKKAIVTGAAQGIGLAVAIRLVQEGCSVTLWDIDEAGLISAKETLRREAFTESALEDTDPLEYDPAGAASGEGKSVFSSVCDVGSYEEVQACAKRAEEVMGGVDILINNAGFMAPGNLIDQNPDVWKKTVDVNLTSIIYTTCALLPGMYARGSGHVVNISSAAGFVGVPGLAVYSATKWGVFGLTESLRHEAAEQARSSPGDEGEVRFSSVHPNFLKTGMFEGARLSGLGALFFPRVESHDAIAEAVIEGALKRGRRVVKRPRSLRLVLLLRGILPDVLFNGLGKVMNLHSSMKKWQGPSSGRTESSNDNAGTRPP